MSILNSLFGLLKFHRKNWKAVVLCILAATIFWLLNALNKTYTTNLDFPLAFEYNAKHYIPVRPLPEDVRMNVTGLGWDLLRKSSGFKVLPFSIPLERPSEVKKIVGSTLPALFSQQLERIQINFVLTDTVYVDLQPKDKIWLRVTVDSAEQYIRQSFGITSAITIVPDTILVEGPINMVRKLQQPYPLQLKQRNINDDYIEEVEVKVPNAELITRHPSTVRVSFNVEKFVDVTDSVKIEILNPPKNALRKMEVDNIRVTLRLPESMIATFPWDSLKAVADLKDLKRGKVKILPDIEGIPEHVQLIKLDTLRISY